jgi:hypothetical protein
MRTIIQIQAIPEDAIDFDGIKREFKKDNVSAAMIFHEMLSLYKEHLERKKKGELK